MPIERQTCPTLAEIEAKHVARYAWASQFMVGRHVLDAACGCGYGSFLLGTVAKTVRGIDQSEEAVGYAMAHYARENVSFLTFDLNGDEFPFAGFQGIVSLETIEHLDNDVEKTLEKFHGVLCAGGIVCISHPINEPPDRNPFHKQFWIDDTYLQSAVVRMGFAVVESKRQPGCRLYDYHLMALKKA